MARMIGRAALLQYQEVDVQGSLEGADPHQLILMSLDAALDRIAKAKGAVIRRDVAKKCHYIGLAMNLLDGLAGSLNLEAGGEIADNLAALYDYMGRRLLQANIESAPRYPDMEAPVRMLDEVSALLGEIKTAWEAIGQQASTAFVAPATISAREP